MTGQIWPAESYHLACSVACGSLTSTTCHMKHVLAPASHNACSSQSPSGVHCHIEHMSLINRMHHVPYGAGAAMLPAVHRAGLRCALRGIHARPSLHAESGAGPNQAHRLAPHARSYLQGQSNIDITCSVRPGVVPHAVCSYTLYWLHAPCVGSGPISAAYSMSGWSWHACCKLQVG